MRITRLLIVLLLLAASTVAFAQSRDGAPIEQQMSAEEFKAAGLDKLSAAELARLNAWLARSVPSQAAIDKAREEGRQEVVKKHRGFFDFGSKEPIVSNIAGKFDGFGKGRQYTLQNSQVWEQVDDATLTGIHKTDPGVKITPGVVGIWYMKINGYNTAAKVQRIK